VYSGVNDPSRRSHLRHVTQVSTDDFSESTDDFSDASSDDVSEGS
jgi:hypothetical protein